MFAYLRQLFCLSCQSNSSMFFRLCCILCCFCSGLSLTIVTINSTVGNIMGFNDYTVIDGQAKIISKFLGIPYAESSAGANRFMKPVPKSPFQATFNATKTPYACYQQSVQEMNGMKFIPDIPGFSEDCLTLNIYVPQGVKTNNKLPVMVWIHGGGFTQGAASIYKPDALSIFGNVIVVTVNYRLGMFGFLRDNDKNFPGNQGLWDQHLAITWVHNNIDSFSGNKDKITIFGESAGSDSVILQSLYAGNKGLFKRVIAESGTPVAYRSPKNASSFEMYLKEIGCAQHSKTLVACMQNKDVISLLSNSTPFGPVVDGDFLVASPLDIVSKDTAKTSSARDFFGSLDIVIGVNNMDGMLIYGFWLQLLGSNDPNFNITRKSFTEKIIPWYLNNKLDISDNGTRNALHGLIDFLYTNWSDPDNVINVRKSVLDFSNDITFFAPSIQTAQYHALQNKGKTYFYEYAFEPENHIFPVPPWLKGSIHADEIQFVFGYPLWRYFGPVNYTYDEKEVSRLTMTFWSNFAKSGNPNLPVDLNFAATAVWPDYNVTSQRYFQVSNKMSSYSAMQHFHARRIAFWNEIVPTIHQQINIHHSKPNSNNLEPLLVG